MIVINANSSCIHSLQAVAGRGIASARHNMRAAAHWAEQIRLVILYLLVVEGVHIVAKARGHTHAGDHNALIVWPLGCMHHSAAACSSKGLRVTHQVGMACCPPSRLAYAGMIITAAVLGLQGAPPGSPERCRHHDPI